LMAAFSAGRPKESNPKARETGLAQHGPVAHVDVRRRCRSERVPGGRARRVRVHAQGVVALALIVVVDLVRAVLEPAVLPLLLDFHYVKGRAISTFYGLAVTPPVGKDDDVSSPTYILVHGAWGGAWCWRDVGVELDQRGVAWRAVDLPSSRNDAVRRRVWPRMRKRSPPWPTTTPVRAGRHSYGGAVAAEVASRIQNLQKCIYVSQRSFPSR